MKIGILALQGAVEAHASKLEPLGVEVVRVRRAHHLSGLEGLILPGGESTTFLHLLKLNEVWDPLQHFAKERPVWGVCAGAILMAKEVTRPTQQSLRLMDISVERNSYGRQLDSFIEKLVSEKGFSIDGVFIRAPRIMKVGKKVEILISRQDEPVFVKEGLYLTSTFHPELTDCSLIHEYFLQHCRSSLGQSIS